MISVRLCVCMHVGTDHPALKYLNKFRNSIATKWHDIGVELLDVEDELLLNLIKDNYPGDANKCTAEMLQLWLARKPGASWGQLLEVLREPNIRLDDLAAEIEKLSECMQLGMYVYSYIWWEYKGSSKTIKSVYEKPIQATLVKFVKLIA